MPMTPRTPVWVAFLQCRVVLGCARFEGAGGRGTYVRENKRDANKCFVRCLLFFKFVSSVVRCRPRYV